MEVRQYTGGAVRVAAWTAVAVVASGAVVVTGRPAHPVFDGPGRRVALVAAVWLLGALGVAWRGRRRWRIMAARAGFEPQADAGGAHPALHGAIAGRTVTVSAYREGALSTASLRVRTTVDGVDGPVTLTCEHVGRGGEREGVALGNPDLDSRFVVTGASTDLVDPLFSPEVQSALMDVDVPGRLSISERAVVFDVPFVRLTGGELRRAGTAVAVVARRLEDVVGGPT